MIIGLVGRAGCGKDTVAAMMPAQRISFAEPLKRICKEVFAFTEAQLYGPSEERNRPDRRYIRPTGEALTARYALQALGTEWGRSCCPDIWAKLGVRKALECGAHAVFTDCRFINEAKAIRVAGGEVWRVLRPGTGLSGAAGLHLSEIEQESPEMDALVSAVIMNIGTLADLRDVVAATWEAQGYGAQGQSFSGRV